MDCSHIKFCTDKEKIDLEKLLALYQKNAFWTKNRNLEDLTIAIAHSNPVISVWDHQKLIGSARATSDGIYRATIWDVVIDGEYQGLGLGRKLVETLISHPLLNRVERIYLTTTHQQKFYQRIGFVENETTTMVLYNTYPNPEDLKQNSPNWEEISLNR
ncbi:GNAT family N-acetyltransferase [Cyanobacterium stanieri LEGE 03274]|uniref:GNAT family N-acetyltransferase n=1 Tax=Cyanobacterium stanieri LEGE 03274 TaxID=1828756 RepID=A0ABR9V459_9CHRO|nr:GNAT family N-acetyltransferase [Cyanobacterium stanieri]MBE9222668.1 GNAT family N-acetyltransferase [Cyanobacterium stanieri LEGE 03274]